MTNTEVFSELELKILFHCKNLGYNYAAINNGHVRVLRTDKEPILVNQMYRVDENGIYFGETLFVPGLFNQEGNKLISLKDIVYQESLF